MCHPTSENNSQTDRSSFWQEEAMRQDQLYPYLAGFYNSYSLASNFTQPYQDEIPDEILFSVNSNFISEGEEDLVQVNHNILHIKNR